jgi:hypothetical protein
MFRWVRAAGLAAFALVAVASGWGGPLHAWRGDVAPQQTSWADHETAHFDAGDLGLNGADAPAGTPAVPVVAPPRPPLRELVQAYGGARPDDAEQSCLASAVYFEAQGEPLEGQLAVAEVVLNRARSARFPASLCAVVRQPAQFSFVVAGRIPPADRRSLPWRKAVGIARIAERGAAPRALPADVLWYHADYVRPSWRRRLVQTARIGLHIFYSRGPATDSRPGPGRETGPFS